jgi:hypothetical protein
MLESVSRVPSGRASATRLRGLVACAKERHTPSGTGRPDESGVRRTTCRICGCALVRSDVSRWYRSGLMG